MKIELEAIDRALLGGELGVAAQRAMQLLHKYGEVVAARKFISVASAHIDGCLYHGQSSIDFAQRFVQHGGRVRVPTTLNVAAVDSVHRDWNCVPAQLIAAQGELTSLYTRLGCLPTLTCAPYQQVARPKFGEHIAWAESNAIVFANSVLGARTDRYGDFTDLCAALTGRVPLAGLHCDERRVPGLIVEIVEQTRSGLPRDLYFAAAGYRLGSIAAGRVPLLVGLPLDAQEDELKALGAAAASSGAVALFHALDITPEAADQARSLSRNANIGRIGIGRGDLVSAVERLCPLEVGEPVAAMCMGTPHFSRDEFQSLARVVAGRRAALGVEVYVSTSRAIAEEIEHGPLHEPLTGFGVRIVVDTCTYVHPFVRNTRGAIVTNSGKFAHYAPGNLRRRVGLMTLERCVRSAELGTICPP